MRINKGDPRIDALSEEELARYYEEHKGDMSLWERKPVRVPVREGETSTVFRLEIDPEELTELFYAAERAQLDLSDFIRTAALDRARSVRSS